MTGEEPAARCARFGHSVPVAVLAGYPPNGLVQETVRAFLRTWYRELVVGVPVVEDGRIFAGDEPGHGVSLREDLPAGAWIHRVSGPSSR